MRTAAWLLLPFALAGAAPEPVPRPARPLPLRIDPAVAHVSAVRELPDGRLLVSDASKPALYLADTAAGTAAILGSAGLGDTQYVQPGGFYAGPNGTILLLDRGQKRVLTIAADGRIIGSSSIAVHGTQSSSTRDVDYEQPDASGHAYFLEHAHAIGGGATKTRLLRFDPVAQHGDPIAELALPEMKLTGTSGGMVFGRAVIGSPADGWGVTAAGRVAVVRAAPYRVEWYDTGGRVTRGPEIAYDALPMTDADKDAFRKSTGPGPSVGMVGGSTAARGDSGPLFAATHPPFEPEGVIVSPQEQVWVQRSAQAGATFTIYDVFDGAGVRVRRVQFPAGSDIVGFGRAAVYVREAGGRGAALKKYAE